MKPFTEKVREHRGQLGLSQQELADKAGIGVRTLTYYECGKRFPQAAQLYKLAKALGVSTEYLKNDEIEDPSYGMDRMDYVEEMRQKGGRRESLDPFSYTHLDVYKRQALENNLIHLHCGCLASTNHL